MTQTTGCSSAGGKLRGDAVRSFRLVGSRPWTADRAGRLAVCALLALAVGAAFAQTARFDFVDYDDSGGVYENRLVTGELSLRSALAVFSDRHMESWAPLTCLSHMLVWHLFGHTAAAHHVINVLLHAASAILLFLILESMTGRRWPSALVAAVFAVHPLRVESVAWVTERKDVLSGFFFLLTLAAYLGYTRRPFSLRRYFTVAVCFVIGLAAKPMAVTLPLLLLLLDYWPLGRFEEENAEYGERRGRVSVWTRPIVEKLPLLAIAGLFCLLTVRGQETVALEVNREYSLAWRMGNAAISYLAYVGQFFCPANLVPFYPRRPAPLPLWEVAAATLTLVSITLAAIWQRRQRPYLLVGWLWYVGMLLPVIGLVQFGAQSEADRFSYLPQIGLTIALVWTAFPRMSGDREVVRHAATRPFRVLPASLPPWLASAAAACVLTALLVFAWRQTCAWRNAETLWAHTVRCSPDNALALDNLGFRLAERGRMDEAIACYRRAVEIKPDYAKAHNNLANALVRRGGTGEAIDNYRKALEIKPNFAEARSNLGIALARCGRTDEAIAQFRGAWRSGPTWP